MNEFWQHLQKQAIAKPNEPAIGVFHKTLETAYTWKTLVNEVEQLGQRLQQDQVKVLVLLAENNPAWVVVDIACRLQGVILIPLPSFFSKGQRQHVFATLGIDHVLCSDVADLEKVSDVPLQPLGRLLGLSYFEVPEVIQTQFQNQSLLPPHTQKITFTSGSTGAPKGVCLSDEQMMRVTDSLVAATMECHVERHLCVLPLATLLENIAGVYVPMMAGAQVLVANAETIGFNGASGFSIHVFLDLLSRCRPNSMILIPQLLEGLVASCEAGWKMPESLRFIAVGGAKVSPALLDKAWGFGLPVYEGYGLSECASVVSLNSPKARKNGSLGKVLGHTSVEIEDSEIVITGPRFLGYIGETQSWQSNHKQHRFATGDLGYLDDEGFLHFQGRKKNVLVSSFGRNVSPEWVEAELNAQDVIAQSVVFGDGQAFCTALLSTYDPQVSDAAIDSAVRCANQALPSYAQIQKWFRLPKPMTLGTGDDEDLLTSNGRPRRAQIGRHFEKQISALYQF